MNKKVTFFWLIGLILWSLSCNAIGGAPSGSPDPEPGTGSVSGSIHWNSAAAANIHVELCEEYSFISGCGGASYAAATNEDGQYLFTSIPPGEYSLAIRLFATDHWVYVKDGVISAAVFPVAANEITRVPEQTIYKHDIQPTNPTTSPVASGPVTLSWRPYESAAYYQILLFPDEGEMIFAGRQMENTRIMAELPAQNWHYQLQVEAFNQNDVKIATTDGFLSFEVAGYERSCLLTLLSPLDNVTLETGGDVVLEWEAHAAAATYDILMWNDSLPDRPHVLDFVGTTVPSYHFGQTLEPGRYVWTVRAFDASGRHIAGSEVSDFTVR